MTCEFDGSIYYISYTVSRKEENKKWHRKLHLSRIYFRAIVLHCTILYRLLWCFIHILCSHWSWCHEQVTPLETDCISLHCAFFKPLRFSRPAEAAADFVWTCPGARQPLFFILWNHRARCTLIYFWYCCVPLFKDSACSLPFCDSSAAAVWWGRKLLMLYCAGLCV